MVKIYLTIDSFHKRERYYKLGSNVVTVTKLVAF